MGEQWTPSAATRRGLKRVWLDAVAGRTIEALRAGGVRPILLKGPAIAQWLYADDPAARGYEDVDLLVAHDQLEPAGAILAELGFERRTVLLDDDPEPHAEAFVRSTDEANVDLHRTLHRCEHLPDERVWACVSRDTDTLFVGRAEVEVPSVPVRLLHVALHPDRAKHGPEDRAVLDLERAAARVDVDEWRSAVGVARELDVVAEMGFGLRLVADGEALADRLGLPATVPDAVLLREATPSTQFVVRLATLPGARAKSRYLRNKLVPPRAYMEQSTALARRGRSGLLLAYAWRIVAAPARVPAAWRGFRRIRRTRTRGS